MREVLDIIKNISKDGNPRGSIFAEVLSISGGTCTAQPYTDMPTIEGIRLQGQEEEIGIYCKPKVGSTIIVSFIENEPYVSMFSEVDKIILRNEDFGGLVKVEELTEKLNNLENKVNSLVNMYNLHIHPTTSGTISATVSQVDPTPLTITTATILENQNVKHG